MCFRLSNFKKLFALLAVGPKYVCPLKPDRRYLKKKKKRKRRWDPDQSCSQVIFRTEISKTYTAFLSLWS